MAAIVSGGSLQIRPYTSATAVPPTTTYTSGAVGSQYVQAQPQYVQAQAVRRPYTPAAATSYTTAAATPYTTAPATYMTAPASPSSRSQHVIQGPARYVSQAPAQYATSAAELKVVFQPGAVGIIVNAVSGVVEKAAKDMQAHESGVRVGMRLLSVNGEPPTQDRMELARAGTESYEVTFAQAFGGSLQLPPAPAGKTPVPRLVQAGWDNHFDAFGKQDLNQIILDYDESSRVSVYNNVTGDKDAFYGVEQVQTMFAGLFEQLSDLSTLSAPVVDVHGMPDGGGQVFLVWMCPGCGYHTATDTFVFGPDGKIKFQNIVVTMQ